jgi:hypothetical protein
MRTLPAAEHALIKYTAPVSRAMFAPSTQCRTLRPVPGQARLARAALKAEIRRSIRHMQAATPLFVRSFP